MSLPKSVAIVVRTYGAVKGTLSTLYDKIEHVEHQDLSFLQNLSNFVSLSNLPAWQVNVIMQDKYAAASGRPHEKDGKARFSAKTKGLEHVYTYQKWLKCVNAAAAIRDPALGFNYIISIPEYQFMLPPDHPLNEAFEEANHNPTKYLELIKTHYEELRKGTAQVLQRVFENNACIEPKTRVFLSKDSTTVKEHVITSDSQWVNLVTTPNHTFHDGDSSHAWLYDKNSPDWIKFVNSGKGFSDVPFFSQLNNVLAGVMWDASCQVGLQRYLYFVDIKATLKTLKDYHAYALDIGDGFAKRLGLLMDPHVMDSLRTIKFLGGTFGAFNLYVVEICYHEARGETEKADRMKAELYEHVASGASELFSSLEDAFCEKVLRLNTEAIAKEALGYILGDGETLRSSYEVELLTNTEKVNHATTEKKIRPGFHSRHFHIFGSLAFGLSLTAYLAFDKPALTQGEEEKLTKEVKKEISAFVSDQALLTMKQKYTDLARDIIADIELKNRTPSLIENALETSVVLDAYVGENADDMLDHSESSIMDVMDDLNLQEAVREKLGPILVDKFASTLAGVYTGEGSFPESWGSLVTQEVFLEATTKVLTEQQKVEFVQARVESETRQAAIRETHTAEQIAREVSLKEELRKLEATREVSEILSKRAEERLHAVHEAEHHPLKEKEVLKEPTKRLEAMKHKSLISFN
ncbi:hypothetical protein ACLOAV_002946 [Pseudogymnoascus australis]